MSIPDTTCEKCGEERGGYLCEHSGCDQGEAMTTTTGTIYEVQAFVDDEWEQIGSSRSKILNAEELARRTARERSVKTRIVMIVANPIEEFYP